MRNPYFYIVSVTPDPLPGNFVLKFAREGNADVQRFRCTADELFDNVRLKALSIRKRINAYVDCDEECWRTYLEFRFPHLRGVHTQAITTSEGVSDGYLS